MAAVIDYAVDQLAHDYHGFVEKDGVFIAVSTVRNI